jgi:hypothetical protein
MIYAQFGLPFSETLRERIAAYAAAKPRGAFGAHRYDFGSLGRDRSAERERFRAYQTRFGVPSED